MMKRVVAILALIPALTFAQYDEGAELLLFASFIGGVETPWTPLDLNPILLLESNDSGYYSLSGSNVTAIADKSVTGANFTQGTAANQAFLESFGGYDFFRFNPTRETSDSFFDYYTSNITNWNDVHQGASNTIVVVAVMSQGTNDLQCFANTSRGSSTLEGFSLFQNNLNALSASNAILSWTSRRSTGNGLSTDGRANGLWAYGNVEVMEVRIAVNTAITTADRVQVAMNFGSFSSINSANYSPSTGDSTTQMQIGAQEGSADYPLKDVLLGMIAIIPGWYDAGGSDRDNLETYVTTEYGWTP